MAMCGSRKFCQRGSSSGVFFLLFFYLMRGETDLNTTKSGPSPARQADDGPTLNAGLVTCDFSGDLDQYL